LPITFLFYNGQELFSVPPPASSEEPDSCICKLQNPLTPTTAQNGTLFYDLSQQNTGTLHTTALTVLDTSVGAPFFTVAVTA